jgi:lysozyme family protein
VDQAVAPPTLTALRQEYERLFSTCRMRKARLAEVDGIVDRIVRSRKRYEAAGAPIGTPWYVIGAIHALEAGLRFDTHLHNGDPLTGRTVHVPARRPANGKPPFTWEESAADALGLKRFGSWKPWDAAGALFKLEEYNGFGYRLFHPDVKSPYLWSYSNHYTRGKYVADGRWDPKAVSRQSGAAVILRRMVDRGIVSGLSERGAPASPPIRYSGGDVLPRGRELQTFLNRFPGVSLEADGRLGTQTSDALERVIGHRLRGDPRS